MELTKHILLLYISAPLQASLILLEIYFSAKQHRKFYSVKDTFTNLYLMSLNLGLDRILLLILTTPVLTWFYEHRLAEISNPIVYWLTLLLIEDFMFYWEHYFDHRVRLLWAVHATHHSSDKYNLSTGFRSSVFQPVYRFLYFIPVALSGFNALDIMFMYSLTQIYGILIHTQYIDKMGFLEYFMATPSHHRVHHASNIKYLDKNMGMVLIIWDKLFGTFQPELPDKEYEPIRYGLTKKLDDEGPVNIVFHEWNALFSDLKKPLPFITKLKYLFMPPGWSHDGSSKTSEELQLELIQNKN